MREIFILTRMYGLAAARRSWHEMVHTGSGRLTIAMLLVAVVPSFQMTMGSGLTGLAFKTTAFEVPIMVCAVLFHVGMIAFTPTMLIQLLVRNREMDPFILQPGLRESVGKFKVTVPAFWGSLFYFLIIQFMLLGRFLAGQGSGFGEGFFLFATSSTMAAFLVYSLELLSVAPILSRPKGLWVSRVIYRAGLVGGMASVVSFFVVARAFKKEYPFAQWLVDVSERFGLPSFVPGSAVVLAVYTARWDVVLGWSVFLIAGVMLGIVLLRHWFDTSLPRVLSNHGLGVMGISLTKHRVKDILTAPHPWNAVWLKDWLAAIRLKGDLIWLSVGAFVAFSLAASWGITVLVRDGQIETSIVSSLARAALLLGPLMLSIRAGVGSLGREGKPAGLLRMSPIAVHLPITKALHLALTAALGGLLLWACMKAILGWLGLTQALSFYDMLIVVAASSFTAICAVGVGFMFPDFSCRSTVVPGGRLVGAWVAIVVSMPILVVTVSSNVGHTLPLLLVSGSFIIGLLILRMLGNSWRYVEVQ